MTDMRSLTMGVGDAVARKLAALQGTRSDAEMAALLGCSRPYYWQIKTGHRSISYAMAKRAASVFPAVLAIVVQDLTEGVA